MAGMHNDAPDKVANAPGGRKSAPRDRRSTLKPSPSIPDAFLFPTPPPATSRHLP
ncbi:MAG: hypothetical protein LBK99_15995 [Opitutaceae bacterium]|nr:hypothetical protein [Opitutaceae bacterium]